MLLRLLVFFLFGLYVVPCPVLAQDLVVTANAVGVNAIGRFAPLELTLSRRLDPGEGRLAVFVGATDLTAFFTPVGLRLRYDPTLVPLPSGPHDLVVYLVTPANEWRELARWPVRVRLPGGFEKASFNPGLNLNNKGQVAEGRFPEPSEELPRRTYQDFSGQLNGSLSLERRGWAVQAQMGVVGVSYQNEALRFGTLQEDAPRVDLAQYLIHVRRDAVGFQVGHVAHGRHRHLINSFGSRGAVAAVALGPQLDASVAVMNGTRIVGWRNPLGLSAPDHRIVSGTVGLEVLPGRPGAFRVEASVLDGSVLPQAGFNQGAVVDAERSRGGGARLLASSPDQRFRLEGGVSGSRFTNPPDPALAQGANLVSVETTTRFAHYVDLTLGLLQNVMLAPGWPLSASATLRRERVDPLYRSVAAFVRSDVLQHTADLRGSVGSLQAQLSYSRSEDNLDAIPSILKTKTRRQGASLSIPTATVVGNPSGVGRLLWPALVYSFDQTHQFGVAIPTGGGFSASHVPDQLSTRHTASADWYGNGWRAGYRLGYAFQDNRQEGREDADFLIVTHSVSLGLTPSRHLDVSLDVSFDRAENKATDRIDRTRRLGVRAVLRPVRAFSVTAAVAPTRTQDDDLISRRTTTTTNLEAAWSFTVGGGPQPMARGQVFVRYARFSNRNQDLTFDLDQETRTWAVNTGVSLTLF